MLQFPCSLKPLGGAQLLDDQPRGTRVGMKIARQSEAKLIASTKIDGAP